MNPSFLGLLVGVVFHHSSKKHNNVIDLLKPLPLSVPCCGGLEPATRSWSQLLSPELFFTKIFPFSLRNKTNMHEEPVTSIICLFHKWFHMFGAKRLHSKLYIFGPANSETCWGHVIPNGNVLEVYTHTFGKSKIALMTVVYIHNMTNTAKQID